MVQWERLEGTTETKVGWRAVTRKRYRFPNGLEHDFDVYGAEGGKGAVMLAFTDDGKILISEQYRAGSDQSMLELPGGFVDENEDPRDTAIRELLEETGYAAENVEFLGTNHPEPYLHMEVVYFIGRGAKKVADPTHEVTEYIEVRTVSPGGFIEAAKQGKTSNAVAALMAYDELKALAAKESR